MYISAPRCVAVPLPGTSCCLARQQSGVAPGVAIATQRDPAVTLYSQLRATAYRLPAITLNRAATRAMLVLFADVQRAEARKHMTNDKTIDALLLEIAQRYLNSDIETLETRNCDRLDFYTTNAHGIADALRAAFRAGRAEQAFEISERDPNAEQCAYERFVIAMGNDEREAAMFEASMLESTLLPAFARAVRDGEDPTVEYWQWLQSRAISYKRELATPALALESVLREIVRFGSQQQQCAATAELELRAICASRKIDLLNAAAVRDFALAKQPAPAKPAKKTKRTSKRGAK